MSNIDLGYVYALCDPETREIRYVGQTIKDPRVRMQGHVTGARKSTTLSAHWIRSLPCEPHVITLERCSRARLDERERYWIDELIRQGCQLTNWAGAISA